MANMDVTIPHQLSKEDALKRIQNLMAETKNEYGDKITNLKENWEGDSGSFSFSAMGFNVSGELLVNESEVEFKGTVPVALSFFKSSIEKIVRDKAEGLLSK